MKKIIILIFLILLFDLPKVQAKTSFWGVSLNDIFKLDMDVTINEQGDVYVIKKFIQEVPTSEFTWAEDTTARKIKIQQNGQVISPKKYEISKENDRQTIKVKAESESVDWTVTYEDRKATSIDKATNFDRIYLAAALESGVYIHNLNIVVHLPKSIKEDEINQRTYAIHGVGAYDFLMIDDKTLSFSGENLSPMAIYTISIEVPKGTFIFSLSKKMSLFFKLSVFNIWLFVAIILPFLAFLFYLYMLISTKRAAEIFSSKYLEKPPDDLSPAVVGLLLRQQISDREIAATIIDLAQRGYIDIVKKPTEYVLGKRQGISQLTPYEAYLYDKLFTEKEVRKIKRTGTELEIRAAQQLYSPKITHFYETIYQEAQRKNYFVKSPAMVILRYRTYGMIFFMLAILIAVLSTKLSSGQPYAIFGALGQIIASALIIKTAPFMPKRTKKGSRELLSWLAFSRFLSDEKSLRATVIEDRLFEKYLPYAVALGKEIDWCKRFSEVWYVPPPWYTADENITLEGFAGSLLFITGSLSRTLHDLREPNL